MSNKKGVLEISPVRIDNNGFVSDYGNSKSDYRDSNMITVIQLFRFSLLEVANCDLKDSTTENAELISIIISFEIINVACAPSTLRVASLRVEFPTVTPRFALRNDVLLFYV